MTGVPHVEGRWWGSSSASIAAHAGLFALMMLLATRQLSSPAPRSISPSGLVYVPSGGFGGGGGGGGDTLAKPPRPAVIKRTLSAATSVPTPSDAIQPPEPAQVVTPTAVETIPGAPASIDPNAVAVGKGDGPGGGSGRGPGSGRGDGTGIDEGRLAGYRGDVYLPGNGVTDPVLVHEVKPNYTAGALRAKLQGTVELQAVVRADGIVDPRSIRIVRSLDPIFGLDREAVEAVKAWRFTPALRKGAPVAALVAVEIAFRLR